MPLSTKYLLSLLFVLSLSPLLGGCQHPRYSNNAEGFTGTKRVEPLRASRGEIGDRNRGILYGPRH